MRNRTTTNRPTQWREIRGEKTKWFCSKYFVSLISKHVPRFIFLSSAVMWLQCRRKHVFQFIIVIAKRSTWFRRRVVVLLFSRSRFSFLWNHLCNKTVRFGWLHCSVSMFDLILLAVACTYVKFCTYVCPCPFAKLSTNGKRYDMMPYAFYTPFAPLRLPSKHIFQHDTNERTNERVDAVNDFCFCCWNDSILCLCKMIICFDFILWKIKCRNLHLFSSSYRVIVIMDEKTFHSIRFLYVHNMQCRFNGKPISMELNRKK